MLKTYLSLNFECSAKKASIFFFLWNINIKYFQCAKCSDSWLLIFFVTSYLTSTCETFLFSKFLVFCKRSNDIDRVPWKMAWILVDFDLPLLTRIPYIKHTNCENSMSVSKETSILLLSWNNLSIISSKWQISWILFDWSLFVTTLKSTSKTYLFWKF